MAPEGSRVIQFAVFINALSGAVKRRTPDARVRPVSQQAGQEIRTIITADIGQLRSKITK